MSTLVEKQVFVHLSTRILPCVVAAEVQPPSKWTQAASAHFYLTELASALVGWGVLSGPVASLMAGKNVEQPMWFTANVAAIVLAVAWTAFVLWFKRNGIAAKLAAQDACRSAFSAIEDELIKILQQEAQPVRALLPLAARIEQAKKHHRQGFGLNPNGDEAFARARTKAEKLVSQFKDLWSDQLASPAPRAAAETEVQP